MRARKVAGLSKKLEVDNDAANRGTMATKSGRGDHRRRIVERRVIPTPSTSLLTAAQRILADGHERDAGQILAEAVEAGFLPATTRKITLYTSLYQYVQRSVAHGRRPTIMQNEATHRFRINHAVDDWPAVELPARRPWLTPAEIDALEKRLRATSTSTATEAFEKAVCDAFEAIGFIAQHVGGIGMPDGILEAPLGPLAYRAILECKTAHADTTVNAPQLDEPARFREAYEAQYAIWSARRSAWTASSRTR